MVARTQHFRDLIVTFQRDGQFPSDHCTVVAKLHLGGAK